MSTKATKSVMEGRRLRFVPAREGAGYDVAAVDARTGVETRPEVALGFVRRETASTDTQIAGTRLRRPGKGRTVWRAEVPREEASVVGGGGARQLVQRGVRERTLDVEWSGWNYDTRVEAAELLVEWHDHPERRRGPARRR
jgi:hypothetical protein